MAVQFGPELPPHMASLRAEGRAKTKTEDPIHVPPETEEDVFMSDVEESETKQADDAFEGDSATNSEAAVEEVEDEDEEDDFAEPPVDYPAAEVVVIGGNISTAAVEDVGRAYGLEILADGPRESVKRAIERGLVRGVGAFLIHSYNINETMHQLQSVAGRMPAFCIGDSYSVDQSDERDVCLVRITDANAHQTIRFALDNRHLDLLEVR